METKICKDCDQELSVALFYVSRKRNSYQAYCKSCANIRRAEWARNNTDKSKRYALKYIYGLTQEQFDALLDSQENKCKICSRVFDTETRPRVDHDHSCCGAGKACVKCVRGLLCNRCNLFLGFYENFVFMDQVKEYLDLTIETD